MRGDFSSLRDEHEQNFNGVLHQQGRVLLDSDWNAQTAITNDWQDTAGRDIIGTGVAAVPADEPNSFKIKNALHTGGHVRLTVGPGHVWADGLLGHIYGDADVIRTASYLQPPIQDPAFDDTTIAAGIRDAVVLEVWREEINGFQIPNTLIEPAIGGPDTTERVHTASAFRLKRLQPGETCDSIIPSLRDDFDAKGKLTVSLQPTSVSGGDCPVVEGGGYTGFEHNLYRIEIANVKSGLPATFKWSQFNGGIVGRGMISTGKITITANLQAIVNSGLTAFYLEAVELDPVIPGPGHWRVTYGAKVTLNNGKLTLPVPGSETFGTVPTTTDPIFFRLWNGIEAISGFTAGPPATELQDGILLKFDTPAGTNYVAGDYWTFQVRAGEIANPEILIDHKAPKGIHYHRVPLAILTWQDTQNSTIEDCRHIFQPLTKLATCCTYRVGDGMHSHGDFEKIQDAINSLPPEGGEVCVLPGEYKESITIDKLHNVTIKGCGKRSRVVSPAAAETDPANPIIHVNESQGIAIQSLAIIAHPNGIGVLLEGPDLNLQAEPGKQGGTLRHITLENLYVEAATRCAIETHVGFFITIRNCQVEMSDVPSDAVGVFFTGDDSLIEGNLIRVRSAKATAAGVAVKGGDSLDSKLFLPASSGKGGLQIGGTSERVWIKNNLIQGGIRNGITLGTLVESEDGEIFTTDIPGHKGVKDPCNPCKPTDDSDPTPDPGTTTTITSAGDLYEIYIEHNHISNMGANGIGVEKFFDLKARDEFITVHRLTIVANEIRDCLNRPIADIPATMLDSMGYGGISLADVEYLVLRDNVIEDNGPDYIQPVCGIFILHGEGIEISRNRILNNGARTSEPAASAKVGRRGGINIVYGIAPPLPVDPRAVAAKLPRLPAQNGVPAVKVHENIVTVPLGQALALTALGPVSVVGNQFTSHGVIVRVNSPTFWASTVMIFNLGLSNEFYFQLLAFRAVQNGQVKAPGNVNAEDDSAVVPQPGLDDVRLGQYLANGNVIFSNNQCAVDLLERGFSFAVSSILIFSLDDIGFHANQCDCDLLDDIIISHAVIFGISLRVTDNRFKEGIFNALLSAITLGMLNTTTDNQSTHCLLIRGVFPPIQHSNLVLTGAFNPRACRGFTQVQDNFGGRTQVSTSQSTNANTVSGGPTTTRVTNG